MAREGSCIRLYIARALAVRWGGIDQIVLSSVAIAMCVVGAMGPQAPVAQAQTPGVPHLDHVLVVIMENHGFDQVSSLPYTASVLAAGSSFADSRAIGHPSQPNYIALWSGGRQGISNDTCPAPGSPLQVENLGHACETAGVTWRAYCEDLPSVGYSGCSFARYVRKHAPWTNFGNLDHSRERPFTDLAADVAAGQLPRLSFVVPNQCDNTHDCSTTTGDTWLSQHLPAMLAAVGPKGIVILTYDENDGAAGNQILTALAGAPVRAGFVSAQPVTHYTILRMVCDVLGLAPFGAAALENPITDVWSNTAVVAGSWGSVKDLYRSSTP